MRRGQNRKRDGLASYRNGDPQQKKISMRQVVSELQMKLFAAMKRSSLIDKEKSRIKNDLSFYLPYANLGAEPTKLF